MARYDKTTLWLVQQVGWEIDEDGSGKDEWWHCADLDFGSPVCAFTTRDAAEVEAERLERGVREGRNPFHHGRSMKDRTTMPVGVFRDWLTDAGLDPPAVKKDAGWARWWASHAADWTPEQRAKVWQALDKVRFYVVVELPPAK